MSPFLCARVYGPARAGNGLPGPLPTRRGTKKDPGAARRRSRIRKKGIFEWVSEFAELDLPHDGFVDAVDLVDEQLLLPFARLAYGRVHEF